jgi:hypothetical protein
MKSITLIILALVTLFGISANAKEYNVTAEPGKYDGANLNESSSSSSFTAEFKVARFTDEQDWPSAAYVGFYEGTDQNNSFQFILMKNKVTDEMMVAGYRIIEEGKQVEIRSLKQHKPANLIKVKLSILDGMVTVSIDGEEPVKIQTKLGVVTPYLQVASGTAFFNIST